MARLVSPRLYPRIWGSRDLRAWYPERSLEAEAVGEAWMTPPAAELLIKLLFPADKLSVQVHPDDAYAAAHGLGRGKTEIWYVLEAEPGARLGVGLRAGVPPAAFAAACHAGTAADLLDWIPAGVGDLIHIPAGTVHAIGSGVVLCEVQQPSDNTFRLDDYGRRDAHGLPRELHLGHGLAVARATQAGKILYGLAPAQSGPLFAGEYFHLERILAGPGQRLTVAPRPQGQFVVNLGTSLPGLPRAHVLMLAPEEPWNAVGEASLLLVFVPTSVPKELKG